MYFKVCGRQTGKTSMLVDWVRRGKKIDSYPGFSRVILVHSIQESMRLRETYDLAFHQVFTYEEWHNAYPPAVKEPIEIGIDNLDIFLRNYYRGNGHVTVVTATGEVRQ